MQGLLCAAGGARRVYTSTLHGALGSIRRGDREEKQTPGSKLRAASGLWAYDAPPAGGALKPGLCLLWLLCPSARPLEALQLWADGPTSHMAEDASVKFV